MDASEWMKSFRKAHEAMRANQLGTGDKRDYMEMREQLAASMVKSQGLLVDAGKTARKTFRVAQAYQVELDGILRTLTRDISVGGFSSLITSNPKEGDIMRFTLTLGKGAEPISGEARVISSTRQAGNSRVSVSFIRLSESEIERLEMALFDAVLARFGA